MLLFKILLFLLLFPVISNAQKEANNWHFGYGAGLDFNLTPVSPTTKGSHMIVNGSASISDKNGVLLFYTDGERVWNRNNQLMSNGTGLRCYESNSAQSVIIVPKPNRENWYYILTIDEMTPDVVNPNYRDGVFCSEVDMTAESGLGAVVSKNKVVMEHPTNRVMTAVLASNKKDYWLVVHASNSFNYMICSITETNIGTANVTGFTTMQPHFSSGQIKFSPDGKKLAMANTAGGTVELFDFIEKSINGGRPGLDNPRILGGFLSRFGGPYGIEFSPDVSKLYVTDGTGMYACCDPNGNPNKESYVYQFDITQNTEAGINASKLVLSREISSSMMQLAPDGKIYVAGSKDIIGNEPGDYLGVIEKPNEKGVNCNFNYHGLKMNEKLPRTGLPNFVQSWFYACNKKPDLGNDTILCEGNSMQLDLSGMEGSLVWNDGSISDKYNITKPGLYSVLHTSGNCVNSDTINVHYLSNPKPPFPLDTAYFSPGSSIQLNIQQNDVSYLWHDGQTFSSYIVTSPGEYKVQLSNDCGTIRDSVTILALTGIYIPNAFTPNGDGLNDHFRISGINGGQAWSLTIFNRWGELVYNDDTYDNSWNANGQIPGVYVYILQQKETGQFFKGTVTIIK